MYCGRMIAQKSKIKVLVIVGQTASGKSDLAVDLALKCSGEIISADSRQVYKGLDIGTGKITKTEMKGIKHYLLDVASHKSVFTVTDFVELVRKSIADIASRGKLPIIAGGTMFYIDALLANDNLPEVPPNKELRNKLEKKSAEFLFKRLKQLDAARAKMLQKDGQEQNKRRIIRAIEIATALGSVPPFSQEICKSFANYEVLKIGIKIDKDELRERIKLRTKKRIRAGMVAEACKLHKKGLTYKRMRELGLEYGHLADYLQRKITKDELIWRIERDDWRYARKQMSWWKRDSKIKWFSLEEEKKIEKLVSKFVQG